MKTEAHFNSDYNVYTRKSDIITLRNKTITPLAINSLFFSSRLQTDRNNIVLRVN